MKKLLLLLTMSLFVMGTALAQRTVSGMVTGSDGEPLIGASVLVKGTTAGTITDVDGSYELQVPEGGDMLVFSYTGFETQEIPLGASNSVDVTLSQGLTLSEAVVTALGVRRDEKSVGYAVQKVDGSEVLKANETNLVQALSGKVAGMQVTGSTGAAGGSSFFLIRGAATINGNNQPLIVVDGVPIDNSQLRSGSEVASVAYSNRAIDINQDEIEDISVLKGAAATAIYGSLAGNGAIIITTKRGKAGKQKVQVDYSANLTFSEYNKVMDLQSTYAQGLFGNYAGPQTGSGYSWGPRIDTLSYTTDPDYLRAQWGQVADFYNQTGVGWDPNGAIVGQSSPLANGQPVNAYDPYEFFRTGVSTSHNLGITASNEVSSLRFSAGFLQDQGIIPNNEFTRINFSVNADTKLDDNINLGVGVQYINSGGTRIEQGSNTSGVMLGLQRTSPTFDNSAGLDPKDIDSENSLAFQFPNGRQRNYRGGGGYDNPFWTSYRNPLNDNVNRLIANLNFSWDVNDWVNLTWRSGIDYYTDDRKQYFAIGSRTLPAGQVFEDLYTSKRVNSDLILNFNRDINDWLNARLTLGQNIREFTLDNEYSEGNSLVIPGFYDISNTQSFFVSVNNNIGRVMGYYASLEFGINDYLFLNGTYRLDYDISIPEENNPYDYWSVSGSFVFSELMDNNDVLSFGKLRASYGLVGLGTFAYSTNTYFNSSIVTDGWVSPTGVYFPALGTAAFTLGDTRGNPQLRPEIQKSFEVGTDLRFFNNRLGLDLTYYNSTSEDIILGVPLTGSTGFDATIENAAKVSNKGIEAILYANPVRGDFNWEFNVNFTRNVNNVDELAEGVDNVYLGGFTGASTRAVVGVPYGSIFGFGFYRDAAGNRVIGADGFPILDPNETDWGTALPDFTVGFRNTFTYKGFSLSALLDVKQGGVVWNGTKGALYFWGTSQETADLRGTTTVFDGAVATFDAEGNLVLDANGMPVTGGANTQEVLLDENWLAFGNANGFFGDNTEDFVEDASWVRLRDVSLSYQFPGSMIESTPFRSLSLTVSARNLFLDTPFTGIDPETNLYGASNAQGLDYFNMPNTKSYSIGLRVGF